MELSVIIPVFNGADTLRRCLDSVIGQQIEGMEIILVDDGSTDNSLQICTQYAEKHAAITVIHQTNKGLSEARNAALEIAKADYLTFIDCDDYLEPHTYKGLMNRLKKHENIDILEYSVDERIGGKHHTRLQLSDRLFTNWQSYWLKTKAYKHAYAWNKIFRKALFAREQFKANLIFEDIELMSRLLKHCKNIMTTSHGYYHYTFNPLGITANANGQALESMLRTHCKIMKQCVDKEYFRHVLNIQLDVYRMNGSLILTDYLPYRGGIKLTLYHLLGLKRLCMLHQWFWKMKDHVTSLWRH